jgi:hypothetical protein
MDQEKSAHAGDQRNLPLLREASIEHRISSVRGPFDLRVVSGNVWLKSPRDHLAEFMTQIDGF